MKIVLMLVMACATLAWTSPILAVQEDVEPPTHALVPTLTSDTGTSCTCDGEGDCTGDCIDCTEDCIGCTCDGEGDCTGDCTDCTCDEEITDCHSDTETTHCGGGCH